MAQLMSIHISTSTTIMRGVLNESMRVHNHLLNIGCHAGDVGYLVSLLMRYGEHQSSCTSYLERA